MTYRVEPEIFHRYPSFCRAVVVLTNTGNQDAYIPELHQKFRDRIAIVRDDPTITTDHPRIEAWRQVYRTFLTAGGRKLEPSVRTLVARIKKGKGEGIPFITPLVCISNLVSLEFFFPSGLIDSSRVSGNLVLGIATGGEVFEPIGSTIAVSLEAGEIVYYDDGDQTVMCAGWNSRAGRATLIQPATTSAVLDFDGLASVDDVYAAGRRAADLATTYCGATTRVHLLTPSSPEFLVQA